MQRSTVLIIFSYNRPDLTMKRLRQLVGVNCKIVVSVDAPKVGGPKFDFGALKLMYESQVQFLQNEENLGTAKHIVSQISDQFKTCDNVIIIEDDISVDKASVDTLIEILKFRLPEDVLTIGLFGSIPGKLISYVSKSYWRKTRYFSAWGWAIQREDWPLFKLDIKEEISQLKYSQSWLRLNEREKRIFQYRFEKVIQTPALTWDYQMMFYGLLHDKKHLLPLFRCCDNNGFGDLRAVNTKTPRPKWYVGSRGIAERGFGLRLIPSRAAAIFEFLDKLTWAGSSFLLLELLKAKSRMFKSSKAFKRRLSE